MAFESLLLLHVENELNNEEVLFFPDNEQYRNLEMPDQSYSSFDLSKYRTMNVLETSFPEKGSVQLSRFIIFTNK